VHHRAAPYLLIAAFAWPGLACKARVAEIKAPFADDFERVDPGPDWRDTGGGYRIKEGKLNVMGAHNHPLWLRRKLPANVVVDFDAMSKGPSGDLKVELYADGESFDPDKGRYDPSGYIFILGGWNNSTSVIGRLGEHDDAVKAERRRVPGDLPPVVPGRTYHFTITRKGGQLDWKLDGAPFLSWNDPSPLHGGGHEFFGVNNWEADVYFDNLRVRPAD
jgi:hypothetical protein